LPLTIKEQTEEINLFMLHVHRESVDQWSCIDGLLRLQLSLLLLLLLLLLIDAGFISIF
jgi:hypothetical protein